MKAADILKLKLGIAISSVAFLLIGSRLFFGQWVSIPISFWILIGVITYGCVYRTFNSMLGKNTRIVFHEFELAGTITFLVVIGLATIMFYILYPLIGLFFFGLSLMSLSVFAGLKFITFDFDKNVVEGLFGDKDSKMRDKIVSIHSDYNQIEIRSDDNTFNRVLKKEMYSGKVWTELIENFQRISLTIKHENPGAIFNSD